MFTGLIEEVGRITRASRCVGGRAFTVDACFAGELYQGASVCVNGVCQTVTHCDSRSFAFESYSATLGKSTLGKLREGDPVNLERAMRADSRFDGHIVQGHISGTAEVKEIKREGMGAFVTFSVSAALLSGMTPEGSVCVDGVSLTIASLGEARFTINLIRETAARTTLGRLRRGNRVNIETDALTRQRAMDYAGTEAKIIGTLDQKRLAEWGY